MTITILAGFQQEAESVGKPDGVTVLMGDARDNLDRVVPAGTTAILGWGTAGALVAPIGIGDIAVTTSLVTVSGAVIRPATLWTGQIVAVLKRSGLFVVREVSTYSDRVEHAGDPAQRLALNKHTGAVMAEELAFAIADWATRHGVPWANVNAASDAFDQTVWAGPGVINPDGSLNVGAAMGDIAGDTAALPDIVRETWTAGAALDKLRSAARVLAAARWALPVA